MQLLIWIVRIIIVILLAWFAAKNADTVVLRGYLDAKVEAPLVLILFAFFGGGLLLGLLASLPSIFRLKREVRQLNKHMQNAAKANNAVVGVGAGAAPPAVQNASNV